MQIHGPGAGETVVAPLGSPVAEFSAQVTVKKWFTTIRTVKNLYFRATGGQDVVNEEILLLSNAAARLKHSNVRTDSERVKRINAAVPPDQVTVSAPNEWTDLAHGDIVRGSVQVFDSGEDARLLVEGSDYDVDYKSGMIRRLQEKGTAGSAKSAGAGAGSAVLSFSALIGVEQSFVIHYSYYTPYLKDRDYHINYRNGLISRLYDGAIASGEKVFVDYGTHTNIDHVIVEEAIDQAHVLIMQHIPEDLEGTQSEGLRYAETYFALANIALISAADLLEARRSDEVDTAAREMMNLSREYEERGWRYLSPFVSIPAARQSAGRPGKNQSWSNG